MVKGDPRNAKDGLLRRIKDEKARQSLIVDFEPLAGSRIGELTAEFNIVLGQTPNEDHLKEQAAESKTGRYSDRLIFLTKTDRHKAKAAASEPVWKSSLACASRLYRVVQSLSRVSKSVVNQAEFPAEHLSRYRHHET